MNRDKRRSASPHRDNRPSKRQRSSSPPPPRRQETREDRERDRDAVGRDASGNSWGKQSDHDTSRDRGNASSSTVARGAADQHPVRGVHAQRVESQEGRDGWEAPPTIAKEEPNYVPSGKLAADQNTYKGVVLKYSEPVEARKSSKKWRLYVFKGKEQVDLLHVHRQSAYLIGRERLVADIPIDHPSCSKQHAVLQYRQVQEKNDLGDSTRITKPYVIDLESANGTFLNGDKIDASRYYELKAGDNIRFGFSSREYVILPEDAAS
ncbi:hypothetical protein SmJEL517_g05037 [Synchytrium microbalum]|uniref:FHA domain-containing protein n=1 Tax=Synchytrium microbalum TaxID=1806994 RepID=A0A507BWY2_9FUNG|nr:uncharacterized protein SmJEL517_g05037 [Synchytrium microbalum]TPX31658.1 hypothetical protein SmJEL517_g05037 [Synchytrium microbalum]